MIDIRNVMKLADEATAAIMGVYRRDFNVKYKADKSPLTEADRVSNNIICTGLRRYYPDIPILSEEEKHVPYEVRRNWSQFWLIDPLDGTKEFIKKNGEFTVNIALIEGQSPILGVVAAPALNLMYVAESGKGAFKIGGKGARIPLPSIPPTPTDRIIVAGSRSHPSEAFEAYVAKLKGQYREVEVRAVGSALKICLVAEGEADVYPRLGPTMEWDTAAAHAIALEAGRKIIRYQSGEQLVYNKEILLNDWFIVE